MQVYTYLYILFFSILSTATLYAQCAFQNNLNQHVTLRSNLPTMLPCVRAGEHVTVDVQAGETYTFSTCGATGDLTMTLYDGARRALAFDDDGCASYLGGPSIITWTASFSGTAYLQINLYPCNTGTSCKAMTITCNTCGQLQAMPGGLRSDQAQAICTNDGIAFPAGVGGNNARALEPNVNYGCLGSTPNPAWYYLEIDTAGDLAMTLLAYRDVDFALWGPYSDLSAAINASGQHSTPLDCSYSASSIEHPMIQNAKVGEVYIMLITNYSNQATDVFLSKSSGSGATNCDIITFPILLEYFSVKTEQQKAKLQWYTASEENASHIEVERSDDKFAFEQIGSLAAKGTGTYYEFVDNQPQADNNYYRLKLIDTDGTFTYSEVRHAHFKQNIQFHTYPSPSRGDLFVQVPPELRTEKADITVLDALGRIQFSTQEVLQQQYTLALNDLANGLYVLQIKHNGKALRQSFVLYK